MRSFDTAVGEYDAARPSYPGRVYELLEDRTGGLGGKRVADGGAGTGIVARQLLRRGADVVAFDPGPGVLGRAKARTPSLTAVISEAEAVPLRSRILDLVCFGQSWHWVDQEAGAEEMARLLKPGGWWSAWWSHPWADGEAWFERYYGVLEAACPGFSRHQRDTDWCSDAVRAHRSFDPPERHVVTWERRVTVEDWVTDLRSHSYVIDLGTADRAELLTQVRAILARAFPTGTMEVPYQTRVWLARRH